MLVVDLAYLLVSISYLILAKEVTNRAAVKLRDNREVVGKRFT